MPRLRDMIDGKVIYSAGFKPKNPSPGAQHVGSHVQDPFGQTKDMVDRLNKAKMNYG